MAGMDGAHIRSLAFRTDLGLLQFGSTTVQERTDYLVVSTPDNPNYWWGNFLLLAEVPPPADAPRWVERHHAHFPTAGHVALGFDVTAGRTLDLAGFAALGMDVDASVVMTARRTRPPRRQHPTAVNRPLVSDDDWQQSVDLSMRCHDDGTAGHDRFTRAKVASYRRLVDDRHGAWFGAFLDGRLVAQLGLFAIGDGLARYQSVETHPNLRRRGLAAGLLFHASRYGFDELGAATLVIVADPEYVAIDLYRAVGFSEGETQLQAAATVSR